MMKRVIFYLLLIITTLGCKTYKIRTLLFVGSYTDKLPGKGIKVYDFDTSTGEVELTFEVDSLINSSFLKISPNGRYLYSVIESQMENNGKVAAFAVDSLQGSIRLLNQQDCGGRNPVHLEIDKTGKYLINSNYTDPSITVFNINSDGSLNKYSQIIRVDGQSILSGRQDRAHIHSSNFSPDGSHLFAQDLGSDKIHQYDVMIDQEGLISLLEDVQIQASLGSGPRHFAFHPNGAYGYGIAELSGRVLAYRITTAGSIAIIDDYPSYRDSLSIYRSADIHISPDGRFLYATNRGPEEDSIVIFSIDLDSGKLTLIGHESSFGRHPRNFAIDPTGHFVLVANQFSNNIIIFKRDIETGKLTKLSHEIKIKNPSSIQLRTYKVPF